MTFVFPGVRFLLLYCHLNSCLFQNFSGFFLFLFLIFILSIKQRPQLYDFFAEPAQRMQFCLLHICLGKLESLQIYLFSTRVEALEPPEKEIISVASHLPATLGYWPQTRSFFSLYVSKVSQHGGSRDAAVSWAQTYCHRRKFWKSSCPRFFKRLLGRCRQTKYPGDVSKGRSNSRKCYVLTLLVSERN